MNVVLIEDFIVHRLNTIAPNARERKGLCKVMSFITRQRLIEEAQDKALQDELVSDLEKALSDVPQWQRERMQESF